MQVLNVICLLFFSLRLLCYGLHFLLLFKLSRSVNSFQKPSDDHWQQYKFDSYALFPRIISSCVKMTISSLQVARPSCDVPSLSTGTALMVWWTRLWKYPVVPAGGCYMRNRALEKNGWHGKTNSVTYLFFACNNVDWTWKVYIHEVFSSFSSLSLE